MYLITKKSTNFECLHIRQKRFFGISQKQELIEQNYVHFWIQRAQITLENCCLPCIKMSVEQCYRSISVILSKSITYFLSPWKIQG